jgi:hypothetical protein
MIDSFDSLYVLFLRFYFPDLEIVPDAAFSEIKFSSSILSNIVVDCFLLRVYSFLSTSSICSLISESSKNSFCSLLLKLLSYLLDEYPYGDEIDSGISNLVLFVWSNIFVIVSFNLLSVHSKSFD